MADDQVGPPGITPSQADAMGGAPSTPQPPPQPPSPTPGPPSAVHDQGSDNVGPPGITPSQADVDAGVRGPANYQSAEHARSGVGANILKSMARGFAGLPVEAASVIASPWRPKDVTRQQAVESVWEQWGIAAPKEKEDPARFVEDDPHPQTTEIERDLEHGWGEFLGGLATPLPKLEQLGAAAKAVGGAAAKTGIPQAIAKGAVKTGEALGKVPGVGAAAEKVGAAAAKVRSAVSPVPGADPQGTLGMRMGSDWLQRLESGLGRLPGGNAIWEVVNNLNVKYGDETDAIINNLAGGRDVSPTTIGTQIEEQLGEKRLAQMRAIGKDVYDDVHNLVQQWHGSVAVYPRDTMAALEDLVTPAEKAGHVDPLTGRELPAPGEASEKAIVIQQKFAGWLAALKTDVKNHGYLPYESMKRIRTEIGREIDRGPFNDLPNAQMRRIYESMTNDMMHGAATIGDHVVAAINKANTTWAAIKDEQRLLDTVLGRQGGPEKVFSSLMSTAVQSTWHSGATVIKTVLNAVDEPTRQLIAAGALRRMGRATKGMQTHFEYDEFNAGAFFNNWKSLSDEARKALFGNLPQNYAQNMTALQRNMEALRHFQQILPNPSGTSRAWYWGAMVTEAGNAIIQLMMGNPMNALKVAALPAGTKIVATALTQPQTVKWLAQKSGQMLISAIKATAAIREHPDEPDEDEQQQQPNFSGLTE